MSASNWVIAHDKITDVMASLGYAEVEDGVCNGLAHMLLQAGFCGEKEVFMTRLHFICGDPWLLNKIATAKAKKGVNLTERDRACIDILAFFDGVQLHQNFNLYPHLLKNGTYHLDAATISELTLPLKLEKRRVVEIYSDNRLFSFGSMQIYLEQLTKEFSAFYKKKAMSDTARETAPDIGLAFHSCSHKIVLGFNPILRYWEIIDANQYPLVALRYGVPAVTILDALTEGQIAPVNISAFTLSDSSFRKEMQTSLSEVRKEYHIDTADACAVSSNNTHLLQLTAMRGDKTRFLRTAKKIKANKNLQLRDYMLPAAKIALIHAQTTIINTIIQRYPDCLMDTSKVQEFLEIAIRTRQNSLIKKIVDYGAKINGVCSDGQRPLHVAVLTDNLPAAIKLISLGADVNLASEQGELPIVQAIKLRRIAMLDYLAGLENISFVSAHANAEPVLLVAVKENSSASCDALLKNKANPDVKNTMGETAALIACGLGYRDCLVSLIAHRANLNLFDKIGRTPLFMCLLRQHWEMAANILLTLKSLESFNQFSYQLMINYLRNIIECAADQLASLPAEKRKQTWLDIKHKRNALGMILSKKPENNCFVFFKCDGREKHLKEIRSACKPAAVEIDSHTAYVRV